MTQKKHPIVIDEKSGEILTNMRATPVHKMPEIPAAYRRGKAGQQLEILFRVMWFKNHPALATLYMGINEFGTLYCYLNGWYYTFDSQEFKDQLTKIAIQDLGMADLAPKVIDNTFILLRTNTHLWFKDAEIVTNPSIRVIDQRHYYIGYALQPGNVIPLLPLPQNNSPFPQGVFVPTGAKWPQYAQHYDDFSSQTLINARANAIAYTTNLLQLINQIGVPDKLGMITLASLVHTLIGKQHLLVEITGNNEAHGLTVFKTIKALIDDTLEPSKPLPKKLEQVMRYGFNEYLISFVLHTYKKMNEDVQAGIIEFLDGTAIVAAQPKAKYSTLCRLKRPMLIKAPESVITLPALYQRTVSLHLPENCVFVPSAHIDLALIDNARIELLRLTQLVSHTIYPSFCQSQVPYTVDIYGFDNMQGFIRLGCEISYLIHGTPQKFVDEFIEWSNQNAFLRLDNNDSAYLVYLWAKDHPGVSVTQSLKEWLNELDYYAQGEGVSLEILSPRKFGADLKQAHSLLQDLGVKCVSHGRSKRLSEWTFEVDPQIGINKSIVVNFNHNPVLQGISAAYV
ncbi:hypothetical protein [Thiomicrospira sp. ALE5]|uniref:hypothetical protein n=1 Tax=Thiomicrospira sp. ALE5 TaxID=748650 RepID=UPI0008ED0E7A|nr:hypothetical protein [Thiomicrospira sp. ALE5]SFR52616.1 hypothetical protein SAMN03092900_0717 [Thiomicrospira sp. ALE5]